MLRPVEELNEYRYTLDLKVVVKNSNDDYPILSSNIRSFSILHNYEDNIIPIFHISVGLEKDLYKLLTSQSEDITMQATLHKYIKNSDIQANELVFSKVFSVFNENNLDASQMKTLYDETENSDGTVDSAHTQQLMDGSFYLIDNTRLDNYMKSKSLSLTGVSLTTAIAAMFADRGFTSLLMSKIPGDSSGTVIVPKYNLLAGLAYVNNKYGIYNADYLFYMDIEENYLLDKSSPGKAVRSGSPAAATLYLEEYGSVESADFGSILNNGTHIINMNEAPVIDKVDTHGEYIDGTNIVGVDTSGNVMSVDGADNSTTKTVRVYNKKALAQLQYAAKESRQRIAVNLVNIDIDAIAPNLLYTILAYPKFQNINAINGKYRIQIATLAFTKETDKDFNLKCSASFIAVQ